MNLHNDFSKKHFNNMVSLKRIFSSIIIFSFVFISLFSHATFTSYAAEQSTKIHILALHSGTDCILLESNGHFALVDFGEDEDTITEKTGSNKYPYRYGITQNIGWDKQVTGYLTKIGVKKLDWVLGTHAHSDHIGLADTIIKKFKVGRVYTKRYFEEYISESHKWDNQKVYDQMINAAKSKSVPITYLDKLGKDELNVKLGDFSVTFMNCTSRKEYESDENINSVVALVKAKGQTAYLAADIQDGEQPYTYKYAQRAIKLAGKSGIDLYKAAHHGNPNNNSVNVLNKLNPKIIVVTRGISASSFVSSWGWSNKNKAKVFSSAGSFKANIAVFSDNGITLTQDDKKVASTIPAAATTKQQNSSAKTATTSSKKKTLTGWQTVKGEKYYYNSKGKQLKGFQKISGKWYFFNRTNGAMSKGWISDKGNKYYANSKGVLYSGGWHKIGSKYYLFKKSNPSKILTGWQKVNNNWYYMNSKGVMQTGWLKLNGNKYYLDKNGKMKTGIQYINGDIYYFDTDGKLIN